MHEPSTTLIERRRRILAAAGDLFAQQPYDVVQMDEIARVAQVAKPTIYRHFGTKEALFGAAVAEALADLKAAAAEIAAREAPALIRFRDLVAFVFRGIGRLLRKRGGYGELCVEAERGRKRCRNDEIAT